MALYVARSEDEVHAQMDAAAAWGEAERIVDKVLDEWRELPEGFCGLSLPRRITDALTEAGLLRHSSGRERGPDYPDPFFVGKPWDDGWG